MAKYDVMFVMPVSCTVTVEVGDDVVDEDEIINAASCHVPRFTAQGWDESDATPYDEHTGEPYSVELVEE